MNVSVEELRILARWAASCATRSLRRFEAVAAADPRPRDAIVAARAFARGGPRTNALRAHVWAALAAAREIGEPAAAAAARAAASAAGVAYTHAELTAQQTRHVFAPGAYAALAARDPDRQLQWAIDHASPAVRALVRRIPNRRGGRGELDLLMARLDAGLRAVMKDVP